MTLIFCEACYDDEDFDTVRRPNVAIHWDNTLKRSFYECRYCGEIWYDDDDGNEGNNNVN